MKSKTSENDGELVRSYQSGDKTAWDILCLRYERRLAQFFYNRGINNPADVQDLVQDTLLEVMQQIDIIRKPESFRSWLFTIAKGQLARWFEAQEKREIYEDMLMETDVKSERAYLEPENIVINNEHKEIVFHLIAQFPEKQREAILLSAEGTPYKEIAETLDTTTSNVKVLVKRGRDKLKTLLKAKYPDDFADIIGSEAMQSLLDEQP